MDIAKKKNKGGWAQQIKIWGGGAMFWCQKCFYRCIWHYLWHQRLQSAFSALRQLKKYLTSTMKQDCLNKLEQLPTVRCIVPNRWLRMCMTERKISPPPPPPPTPSRFKTLRCLSFFCNVQWHISQRNFWSTPHNFPRTTNKIQRHFTEVRPQVSTNQPYKRVV